MMADNTLLQLPYNAVRLGIERDKTSINIDELNSFDQNINNRYDHNILALRNAQLEHHSKELDLTI